MSRQDLRKCRTRETYHSAEDSADQRDCEICVPEWRSGKKNSLEPFSRAKLKDHRMLFRPALV